MTQITGGPRSERSMVGKYSKVGEVEEGRKGHSRYNCKSNVKRVKGDYVKMKLKEMIIFSLSFKKERERKDTLNLREIIYIYI